MGSVSMRDVFVVAAVLFLVVKRFQKGKSKQQGMPKWLPLRGGLGLILALIGAQAAVTYVNFETGATHATGIVRKLSRHSHRTGRGGQVTTVTPQIEFTPAGSSTPMTAATTTEVANELDVGQEVKIEYQTINPEHTLRLDHGLPLVDFGVGIAGVTLFVDAIAGAVRKRRIQRAREEARAAAQPPLAAPVASTPTA